MSSGDTEIAQAGVRVIVVTYNSAQFIGACLDALAASSFEGQLDIVVIDNDSRDGTADLVEARFPEVVLIRNLHNRGFAAACNQGLQGNNSGHVLLLNPDALVFKDTVARMVEYLHNHPRTAIVGPRLVDDDGALQRDCSATGISPGFTQALFEYTRLHRWFPNHPAVRNYFQTLEQRLSVQAVAMVQGACFMFRSKVVAQVGEFDEGYFLYFEETDFCRRVLDAGWQVIYHGEILCRHHGAHSMPGGQQAAWYFIRSLYRYHARHSGRIRALGLWLMLTPYHLLKVLRMQLTVIFRPCDSVLKADLKTARQRLMAHFWFLRPAPHLKAASDTAA